VKTYWLFCFYGFHLVFLKVIVLGLGIKQGRMNPTSQGRASHVDCAFGFLFWGVAFKPPLVSYSKQGRMNPTSQGRASFVGCAFGFLFWGVAFKPPLVGYSKQGRMNPVPQAILAT